MEENKSRLIFIKVVLAILAVILVVRLFYLQIIKGDQYLAMSTQRYTVGMVDKAPRGEIFDRYGKPLITNRVGYSLQLQKTDISDDELNDVLLKVIQILQKTNYAFYDTLPITSAPYEARILPHEGAAIYVDKSTTLTPSNCFIIPISFSLK